MRHDLQTETRLNSSLAARLSGVWRESNVNMPSTLDMYQGEGEATPYNESDSLSSLKDRDTHAKPGTQSVSTYFSEPVEKHMRLKNGIFSTPSQSPHANSFNHFQDSDTLPFI
jgi:hypothetical protein